MGSTEGLSRGLSVEDTGAPVLYQLVRNTWTNNGCSMEPIDERGPVGEKERMPIHRKAQPMKN